MAHNITEAKIRLHNLNKAEKKRKHKEAAAKTGFDVIADYEAWQVLEDLRHATLTARKERAATEAKGSNSGGMFIPAGSNVNVTVEQRGGIYSPSDYRLVL